MIDHLRDILALSEVQKKALLEGRLEAALVLQEKRQSIIKRVQKFDAAKSSAKQSKDLTEKFQMLINKILLIDSEMEDLIKKELKHVSERFDNIRKIKKFCNNTAYSIAGKKLNINA
ncbi:MAG: hypothetical protein HY756_04335 [Nitrospirae bacterium]|nr:hypothetical protein [Nitrospirota bacterium]